jgi:hypothetical protein
MNGFINSESMEQWSDCSTYMTRSKDTKQGEEATGHDASVMMNTVQYSFQYSTIQPTRQAGSSPRLFVVIAGMQNTDITYSPHEITHSHHSQTNTLVRAVNAQPTSGVYLQLQRRCGRRDDDDINLFSNDDNGVAKANAACCVHLKPTLYYYSSSINNMATMPTEPANLNPPVLPVGQGLTLKELQVFRPVSTKHTVAGRR